MGYLPHWTITTEDQKIKCVFCDKIVGKVVNGKIIQIEPFTCEEKPYNQSGIRIEV